MDVGPFGQCCQIGFEWDLLGDNVDQLEEFTGIADVQTLDLSHIDFDYGSNELLHPMVNRLFILDEERVSAAHKVVLEMLIRPKSGWYELSELLGFRSEVAKGYPR